MWAQRVRVARWFPGRSPRTRSGWESGPGRAGPASSGSLGVQVPRRSGLQTGHRAPFLPLPPTSTARPPPPSSPRTLLPASWKDPARCVERAGGPGRGSAPETVACSQGSSPLPPPVRGRSVPGSLLGLELRELGVLLETSLGMFSAN